MGARTSSRSRGSHRNPFFRPRQASTRENGLEKRFRTALTRHGVRFQAQKQFGIYRVDFYLPDYHAVAEVDGRFWHPTIEQASTSVWKAEKVAKAALRDQVLATKGLLMFHCLETEIRKDVDSVVLGIIAACTAARAPHD